MSPKPNRSLTKWLTAADPAQRKLLAKLAQTSLAHLQHVAKGRRQVSADLAQRIAHASQRIFQIDGALLQTELCEACRKCPLLNGK